jgi:hypothetical protein
VIIQVFQVNNQPTTSSSSSVTSELFSSEMQGDLKIVRLYKADDSYLVNKMKKGF